MTMVFWELIRSVTSQARARWVAAVTFPALLSVLFSSCAALPPWWSDDASEYVASLSARRDDARLHQACAEVSGRSIGRRSCCSWSRSFRRTVSHSAPRRSPKQRWRAWMHSWTGRQRAIARSAASSSSTGVGTATTGLATLSPNTRQSSSTARSPGGRCSPAATCRGARRRASAGWTRGSISGSAPGQMRRQTERRSSGQWGGGGQRRWDRLPRRPTRGLCNSPWRLGRFGGSLARPSAPSR